MKLRPQNWYIPKDYTEKKENAFGICFHNPEKTYAIGYTKNAKKNHSFHYRFSTPAQCTERMASFLKGLEERENKKMLRAIERNQPHTLKPGDILYSTWGYDQTNVDFYQVIKTTKNTATIEKIGARTVKDAGFMSSRVVANPGHHTGEIRTCKVDGRNNWINLTSFSGASLWDGSEITETHYA